jgi:hypothetical protein
MVRACLALSVLIIGFAGCGQHSGPTTIAAPSGQKYDIRIAALFGGAEQIDGFVTSGAVEALRIDPTSFGNAPAEEGKVIAGYPITSEPVKLSAEQTKALAAILTNPGTYSFEIAKGCEFMPGVALRAQVGKHEVVMLLCFSCKELAVFVGGKRAGVEDFDSVAGKLKALVKNLFPEDKEIQGL